MKIYTITFHFVNNFGAVLQSYALQKYLIKQGHDVKIIDYRCPGIIERINKSNTSNIKKSIYKLMSISKERKFKKFIEDNMILTDNKYMSYSELKNSNELDAQLYIVGSDQVWNTNLTSGIDKSYFLEFARKDSKKVSYAASIGKDVLSNDEVNVICENIKDFDYLSVREESAAKILAPNIQKSIETVLDPTLLLEANDYYEVSKLPKENNYIFVYDLDGDLVCAEYAKYIKKLTGKKVIQVSKIINRNKVDKIDNCVGPSEFLGYIINADYIVSNSFHSAVFSIIFKKRFFAVPHRTANSRLENILEITNLTDRFIRSIEDIDKIIDLDINYDEVHELLIEKKLKSIEYLSNILK